MINRWPLDNKTEQGIQRFFRNTKISPQPLIEEIKSRCKANCPSGHVLVIEDTVEFNYQHLAGKLRVNDRDIGYISDNRSIGFMAHPALAVDAQQGVPLGLSELLLFERRIGQGGKKARGYTGLPLEEKESYKWLLSAKGSKQTLSQARQWTMICDREGDIYELFCRLADERTHMIVRSNYDRKVVGGQKVSEVLSALEWQGDLIVPISAHKGRTARQAHLQVRWASVELAKPDGGGRRRKALKGYPKSLPLYIVEVRESEHSVPAGEEPVHWLLWTTHEVQDLQQALQIVKWYAQRWWIEELFRVIKTQGFDVERSQLGTGQALKKLVVCCLDQAWKLLLLRQERQGQAQLPAQLCFTEQECRALAAMQPTLEGATEKQRNPYSPQSLAWAVWLIARLGGWKPVDLAKKPPGIITLARGLKQFHARFEGWKIAIANFRDSHKFGP